MTYIFIRLIPIVLLIFSFNGFTNASLAVCAKTPADILFALDTSTSIGSQNFEREKQFVLAFVADMDIGPSDVQVSVGTFSDNARRYFALNSHPNLHDLQAAIKRMYYEFGQTQTHLAFLLAEMYVFTNVSGDRPSATNVMFVLTDGRSQNHTATVQGAQRLKNAGVKIYAIGIGNQTDRGELNDIASDTNHVFMVDSFTDLSSIHTLVQNTYCEGYLSTNKPSGTLSLSTTRSSAASSTSLMSTIVSTSSTSSVPTAISASTTVKSTSTHTSALSSTETTAMSTTTTAMTSNPTSDSSNPTPGSSNPTPGSSNPTPDSSNPTPDNSNPTTDGLNLTTDGSSVMTSVITNSTPSPESTSTSLPTPALPTTIPTPPPIPDGPCEDKITNCAGYGDGVCTSYRKWSIQNCARFCTFCHDSVTRTSTTTTLNVPTTTTTTTTLPSTTSLTTRVYTVCEDKIDRCSLYGPDICFKYTTWAAVQCPKFCVFCEPPSTTTLSTTTTTTTSTTTTPLPSTTPFVCADQAPNCAELGPAMCMEDKAFAMRNCPVFCLLCTPTETSIGVTEPLTFKTSTTFRQITTNPDIIIIGRKRFDRLHGKLLGHLILK
ncbi:uncharacterized protein LOC128192692 [Crassostrea angulata]|uniref:uncharacterized protein LOC128192692 n=1 Tax=Magallana angulata TaxID=2784310 RepID=UPI0022B20FD3|nr:uncharacterized protein LOC128192692 [Crassostrea angulata]